MVRNLDLGGRASISPKEKNVLRANGGVHIADASSDVGSRSSLQALVFTSVPLAKAIDIDATFGENKERARRNRG
jgi:hypothetical protein